MHWFLWYKIHLKWKGFSFLANWNVFARIESGYMTFIIIGFALSERKTHSILRINKVCTLKYTFWTSISRETYQKSLMNGPYKLWSNKIGNPGVVPRITLMFNQMDRWMCVESRKLIFKCQNFENLKFRRDFEDDCIKSRPRI